MNKPLKVYYLDDEPDLCEVFADTFDSENVKITTFTDPKEAIQVANSTPTDLMLIDFRLIMTTGDVVAQAIDAAIPKILITGDLSVNTVYQFKSVLEKPFQVQAILDLFKSFQ